jgi:folate-binding protein YgfZ
MPKPYAAETLSIEGPDAFAFAHTQFSSNVNALALGQWQFSAWLDPQGRVRALFQLARVADDRLLLLLRGGAAAQMSDALRRFVFRSKLTLTALPPRALATGAALPVHHVQVDAETLWLGCGTHSLQITSAGTGEDGWRLAQLHEGWPWLPEQALNEMLAPALSLQRLQAAVIDKGCYPGQEIVARLHYRGGLKRHLHSVTLSRVARAGELLRIEGRDAGRLLDVVITDASIEALAVISDDVVAQATDGRLNAFDSDLVISLGARWPS